MKRVLPQKILYYVLTLILLLAGIFLTYNWQHSKVSNLNTKISNLNSQVRGLNSQIVDLTNQLVKSCPASSDAINSVINCSGYSYTSLKGVKILIFTPSKDTKVASPVAVVGEVPGNWSFEANFPIKLLDSNGRQIASISAHVIGDWMTNNLVSFSAQLIYSGNYSGNGSIVLYNDNPSGLSQNADSLTIPIQF